MKKLFFAAMAATILFTSCEKGSEVQPEPLGETAKLTIGITSPETVRAVGDKVPDDSKVINFKVFVVDGDNSIKSGYREISEGEDLKTADVSIDVTTSAKKVYVIANAGDLSAFKPDTEKEIIDCIVDLNSNGSQTTARWATGEIGLERIDFKQEGDKFIARKEISLTFIAARITLKIINKMEGYDPDNNDKSLVLTQVAVLNASRESKLFGSSLIPKSEYADRLFYTGIDKNNKDEKFKKLPLSDNYEINESLLTNPIPKDLSDLNKTIYYYYVFENQGNSSDEFPTIITIEGEFMGEKVYYPVHLAVYEEWHNEKEREKENILKRGHSYDITITLSVNPSSANKDAGGVKDPTDVLVNALVKVTVVLNKWVPITLEKEFK